jgi:hypothetical protein
MAVVGEDETFAIIFVSQWYPSLIVSCQYQAFTRETHPDITSDKPIFLRDIIFLLDDLSGPPIFPSVGPRHGVSVSHARRARGRFAVLHMWMLVHAQKLAGKLFRFKTILLLRIFM